MSSDQPTAAGNADKSDGKIASESVKKVRLRTHTAPYDWLDELPSRSQCPQCSASRSCQKLVPPRYFCYDCVRLAPPLIGRTPVVKLPFRLDIIKHRKEKNSKSTAIHAPLLVPERDQCRLHAFPDEVPIYDRQTTALVYPSPHACWVDQLPGLADIRTFVLLDCTWEQAYAMRHHQNLLDLPVVKLCDYETTFWRPQYKHPKSDLATIEAAYYLLVEHFEATQTRSDNKDDDDDDVSTTEYDGRYDNLLFFYDYFLSKIDKHKRQLAAEEMGKDADASSKKQG